MFKRKDLLGLKDLSVGEINQILDTATEMKKILVQNVKKTPHLMGKSITTLFYENSTRTRMSFETAGKFMGASCSSINVASSSVAKGETLIDTGKNLDALLTDVIVVRHSMAGAPHLLANNVKASVINAGDGMNEHPTQALLDIFTMKEKFGDIKGLNVTIVGDIKFSRVARSNIWGLNTLGANVTVSAPKTLLPYSVEDMGCKVDCNINSAIIDADVIMGLRMQTERQEGGMFPTVAEYVNTFGLNRQRLSQASTAMIMHPGPINRGVEMSSFVSDCNNSVILDQVTNGVAVRMAILFLLTRKQS